MSVCVFVCYIRIETRRNGSMGPKRGGESPSQHGLRGQSQITKQTIWCVKYCQKRSFVAR